MHSVDLAACSSDELRALAADVHAGQRRLDGYLSRIARAAQSLADTGRGSTAADVLSNGGDLSQRRAKQLLDRNQVGAELPEVGADLLAGEARGENVDAIARRTRGLSPSERERFAALEHDVALRARSLPPETFEKYLADVLRRIADVDEGPSQAERQRAASAFDMSRGTNGMWWLSGSFDDQRGAEINALINQIATELAGDGRVAANHRAAALHQLMTNGTGATGGDGVRMGVGYIVDANTFNAQTFNAQTFDPQTFYAGTTGGRPREGSLAKTWAGDDVDPASVGRLACDADCYAVLVDRLGRPEAVGRTRRRATREQRLQLRALYDGCPLDGTAFDRCEIHHVNVPWEHGGETELDNLLPISVEWHHRIHDRGWTLKMAPDRSLRLWRPDGTLERSIGPPTPITRRE